MPEDLPLEPDLIKVLASDTRRGILGHLTERRMTVTELARETGLGKATVHEHLKKLTLAGLVDRDEDDRLWVYYELTPRGKRILNPQRTRFYLVIGVTVLAGIAAVLAAVLFFQASTPGAPLDDGLAVSVEDPTVYAGEPIAFEALITGAQGSSTDVQAYLLDEQAAEQVRLGHRDVRGIPLESTGAKAAFGTDSASSADGMDADDGPDDSRGTGLQEPSSEPTRTAFRASTDLAAGTYYVFVRGPSGVDNRASMPALQVAALETTPSHAPWYRGLSETLTVNVTSSQGPVDGTLILEPAEPAATGEQAVADIVEGTAQFSPATLDALPAGLYTARVFVDVTERWHSIERAVEIATPAIAVQPTHLAAWQPAQVHISSPSPGSGLVIDVNATHVLDRADHAQGTQLVLAAAEPGVVELTVGRLSTHRVTVHATLEAVLEVHDGPRWLLQVRTPSDDAGLADARVLLDGQAVGQTDPSGEIELPVPDPGLHVLGVEHPNGSVIEHVLHVEGWMPESALGGLALTVEEEASTPGRAGLEITLENAHPAAQPTSLEVILDGRVVSARSLVVPANSSMLAQVSIPVTSQGVFTFDAVASPFHALELITHNASQPPAAGDDGGADGEDGADGADDADDGDDGDDGDDAAGAPEAAGATADPGLAGGTVQIALGGTGDTGDDRALLAEETGVPVFGDDGSAAADEAHETPGPGWLPVLLVALGCAGAVAWHRRR